MGASGASYIIEGPATIYFGAGNCTADGYTTIVTDGNTANAKLLGVTETGVTISTQLMTHRVSSDEYGGTEGPPAELLTLGATATIQGTLVKWGADAFAELKAGLRGVTPGHIPWPAQGVYSGNYFYAFWVVGFVNSYYFPRCNLASQPREWQISVLERRMNLNINAEAVNIFSDTPHIFYEDSSDPKIGLLFPSCDASVFKTR
jgi:hypothetical protein